jgi:hypothetical protein
VASLSGECACKRFLFVLLPFAPLFYVAIARHVQGLLRNVLCCVLRLSVGFSASQSCSNDVQCKGQEREDEKVYLLSVK